MSGDQWSRRTPGVAVDELSELFDTDGASTLSILPGEWTEEGGQLTRSLKLKRNVIVREARAEIEALYLG